MRSAGCRAVTRRLLPHRWGRGQPVGLGRGYLTYRRADRGRRGFKASEYRTPPFELEGRCADRRARGGRTEGGRGFTFAGHHDAGSRCPKGVYVTARMAGFDGQCFRRGPLGWFGDLGYEPGRWGGRVNTRIFRRLEFRAMSNQEPSSGKIRRVVIFLIH